jgi:hypothetical protein
MPAVSMTYLEKVKMRLRVTQSDFDMQIHDLILEALDDLTSTADIKTFNFDEATPLQHGAVVAYVSYRWFDDSKYFTVYNDIKAKMAISGKYRSVRPNEEPQAED